ncbi:GPP34 family phosphoprotein [Lysobacter sp. N42]|uniref:GOLPH3/VPS74 family protein n=2 Tax=Gammaproteobacteria TaxID=1236 RepID=UPI0014044C9E|nr:GPP34 family phosphoprotein [Lysobacter sp. N42]
MLDTLKLHEKLVLLALHGAKGRLQVGFLQYGIAASMLAELLLEQQIELTEGKKNIVVLKEGATADEPLLREVIEKLRASKKNRKLKHWVTKLAAMKGLNHRVAESLAEKHIVEKEIHKVLWVFKARRYTSQQPRIEAQLIQDIRDTIMKPSENTDPRMVLLISIAKALKILGKALSKKELKEHKAAIENIAKGNQFGELTKEIIAAIEVTVIIAATVPAISAATG